MRGNLDIEREVEETTLQRQAQELHVINKTLDCLIDGLNQLDPVSGKVRPDASLRNIRRFLAVRSYNSLRVAKWPLLMGYYQQALALVRMVYEDWLLAIDAEINPETLAALVNNEGKIGKGNLTLSKMTYRLPTVEKELWDDEYGVLSEYAAHPRHKGLKSLILSDAEGSMTLPIGGRYDEWWLKFVLFFMLIGFARTVETIARAIDVPRGHWDARVLPLLEEATSLREQLQNWLSIN